MITIRIFLSDYDDTIIDFDSSLRKVLSKSFAKDIANLPANAYETLRKNGYNKQQIREFLLANKESLYLNALPYPHSLQTVKALKNSGYKIYIITARPEKELKQITYKNLSLNKFDSHIDDIIFTNYQLKGPFIHSLKPAVFVDDQLKHLEDAHLYYPDCNKYILFKPVSTNNASNTCTIPKIFYRAANWLTIYSYIL